MSTKIASFYADIGAKDTLTSTLKSLGGQLIGFTSMAGIATTAIKFLGESLNLAAESETGLARLNATLIATGRGAQISSKQIDLIATSLMKTSTFDDEAIVNAYNALAKFESIPTGNMKSIVKTAMDMSAAMGGDLASNAEAIGRALETGVIPRTWGFSKALKEQFTQEVNAGNAAKALNTMMLELNKRYGGQDAAAMGTYAGQVKAFNNAWDETKESVGAALLPIGMAALGTKGLADKALTLGINISSLKWTFSSYAEKLAIVTAAEGDTTVGAVDMQTEFEGMSQLLKNQLNPTLGNTRELFSDWKGLIDGVAPSLNDLAVAAYEMSLSLDGSFTEDDARKAADYALSIGAITQEEYNAKIEAINFQSAINLLQSKSIDITTNWINIVKWTVDQPEIAPPAPPDNSGTWIWNGYTWVKKGVSPSPSPTPSPSPSPVPSPIPVPAPPKTPLNRYAYGGYIPGRYAITGDSMSGQRTGFEELVDFQQKRVYSAPETRAMGAVRGYAGGSGEVDLSQRSLDKLADTIMYGVSKLQ
jgi:hypothetical protein